MLFYAESSRLKFFGIGKENKMISIKNLVKIYNKGKGNEYKALKGIDFQVQDGDR